MEAEPRKQRPPHPSLPANYVSLAQLQEQRRIKLERQRREEEEAQLRKLKEEEERERLRKLEEGEEGERVEAQRRQTESGTAHLDRRGRRRGPTRWGRKTDEPRAPTVAPPEVVVLPNDGGAVVGGEEGRGEGGLSGGRGRNVGPRWKFPNPETKPPAAAAIGGVGGPLAAERSMEVKPGRGNVEEERKEPPSMGGVALEPKLEERPRNVYPVLSVKGVEGAAKDARKVLHSTVRKGYRLDKLSETAEPDSRVEVGQKLKDLSITKPEGDEVGIVGKEDSVEHWPRRAMMGRRGRYPNFRADGILCPQPMCRPASSKNNVMWVKKIENT